MFVFEFGGVGWRGGAVVCDSLLAEDSGCVSQSTITVINASSEEQKRNTFPLSAESHQKCSTMMSPQSRCVTVLLSIISVYYTLSCCTDHCLWRNHNCRGSCQKSLKMSETIWDDEDKLAQGCLILLISYIYEFRKCKNLRHRSHCAFAFLNSHSSTERKSSV